MSSSHAATDSTSQGVGDSLASTLHLSGIAARALSFTRGTTRILADLDFALPAGTSTAVVGRSGVGKTTLLRVLAGLAQPTSGVVEVGGVSPSALHEKREIGFLFQEPCLWPHRTVWQTMELTYELYERRPSAQIIAYNLEQVGLEGSENLYPHQLSVGMKARLAIARAFCVPPRLLLMDEPFASVDPIRRLDLNRRVQQIRSDIGCSVVWVTHDLVEALQFASHVLVLAGKPAAVAELISLRDTQRFADSAALPPAALLLRDRLLDLILKDS